MPTWAKWTSVLALVAVIAVIAGLLGFYFWRHEKPRSSQSSQPDLVIQDMAWSPTNPSVGETVSFDVTVKNEGGGNSGSSKVYFFVDDSYRDSEQADPIVHGGITTLTFTWVAEAGSHKIRAVGDYENGIAESDEANNEKEVTVTIATGEKMPTITSISPNQGALGQTFYVTITGTNLTGATVVSFGAGILAIVSFPVDSATEMKASISIAGDAAPGARDVSVTTPAGTNTLPGGFSVTPLPPLNVTSISPRQGALEQTFYVTITGTNLTGTTIVDFGAGITVNSYSVNSATQMTANISIAGDAAPGARDVSVTGPVGTGTLPDGLRVTVPLVNIAPLYGIASADVRAPGGAIDGDYSNSSQWNAGWFGSSSNPHWWKVDLQQNRQVSEIVVNSVLSGTGSSYLGHTNVYNLYVSSDNSSWTLIGSGTLAESSDPEAYSDRHILSDEMPAIRYVKYEVVGGTHWAHLVEMEVLIDSGTDQPPVPTVTSVGPDHGAQGQYLPIIINGTNFTGATAVSFGPDITVNSFTVYSATQITANITIGAAATPGARTVVVDGAYLQSGFMVTLS